MSDMYEVEAGKIASQKGKSDAVKTFGQMMVDAHSKTTEELKGIVASESIKVDLPAKLDAKHQKLIDDLNAASDADFDKTYAKQQVDGHKDAVSLFDAYAKKGDNAALKGVRAKDAPGDFNSTSTRPRSCRLGRHVCINLAGACSREGFTRSGGVTTQRQAFRCSPVWALKLKVD